MERNPRAFPVEYPGQKEPGMSLRDWFAGQALVGLIASAQGSNTPAMYALGAYMAADAMLAERAKEPK